MRNEYAPGEPTKTEKPPLNSVSLDNGETFVLVPSRLAQLIRIALKMQSKIDKHIDEINLDFDTRVDLIKGINCHKTVLFARGDISFDHLTDLSIEAEHNGHPEIITLANENPENLMFSHEEIDTFLTSSGTELPVSVHILVQKGKTLIPAHSFLYLGNDQHGRKVCFHKAGPYLNMPFEITTMEKIVADYENVPSYILVTPMNTEAT